jgi:hypothetical protein
VLEAADVRLGHAGALGESLLAEPMALAGIAQKPSTSRCAGSCHGKSLDQK